MTTTYTPIKKNTANQVVYCSVFSQATGQFQANPTIATGDFQRSIDGGAFANMDTLPVVTPAAGKVIAITLSATETNCDRLIIIGSDQAGSEWDDVLFVVDITPYPFELLNTAIAAISTILTGITSLAAWLRGMARKDAMNSTAKTELNTGGGAYDETTDSQEAIKDALATSGTTAAQVWTYATRTLTQTAASVTAAVSGESDLTIYRGDTLSATFTSLTADVSDNDKLWFTFKTDKSGADTAALVMIDKTGLTRINGEAATTAANGAITTPSTTSVTVTLAAVEAAKLGEVAGYYDIQKLKGTTITTLASGDCTVTTDVTRATS